jgi:predicted AAA+ superfamily ATPase
MSFLEFTLASGNDRLYRLLTEMQLDNPLPVPLHEKCLDLYFTYIRIGGMPEVVLEWCSTRDLSACVKVQQDLLATIRDDFNKYQGRFNTDLLNDVLTAVPKQLGNKFILTRVNELSRSAEIKKVLDVLEKARVCCKIRHTSANGLPLSAESNDKFFKVLLLDTAFVSVQLGLSRLSLSDAKEFILQNRGPMAEQYVGQQIRAFQSLAEDPALYYWQRIGGRQGEIDYIIQHNTSIVPIEIKAGSAGSMKSLHQFMFDKKLGLAVRVDLNHPSVSRIAVKTTLGDTVEYLLLSIPFYLVERLQEFIDQAS